jgi:hypothetical protein
MPALALLPVSTDVEVPLAVGHSLMVASPTNRLADGLITDRFQDVALPATICPDNDCSTFGELQVDTCEIAKGPQRQLS